MTPFQKEKRKKNTCDGWRAKRVTHAKVLEKETTCRHTKEFNFGRRSYIPYQNNKGPKINNRGSDVYGENRFHRSHRCVMAMAPSKIMMADVMDPYTYGMACALCSLSLFVSKFSLSPLDVCVVPY